MNANNEAEKYIYEVPEKPEIAGVILITLATEDMGCPWEKNS